MGTTRPARSASASARWVPTSAEPSSANAALALRTRQVPVEDGGGRRRVGEDRVEQLTELDALLGGQLLLADEPGVLDEQRALERHPLDHPQAFPVEAPVVRDDEHDRAQRNPAGQERHDRERLEAEPLPDGRASPRSRRRGRSGPRPGPRRPARRRPRTARSPRRRPARRTAGSSRAPRRGRHRAGSRCVAATRRMRPSGSRNRTVPQSATAGTIRSSTSASALVRFSLRGEHPRHVGQEIGQLRVECVRHAVRSPYGPVIHGLNLLANTVGESSRWRSRT